MRAESQNEGEYGIKRLNLFILTDGMRDKRNGKSHFAKRAATLTRLGEDKYSDWRGMG